MSEKKLNLGVLVSGQGSNLRAILKACREGQLSASVGIVISDKKDAQALEHARQFKVPELFLDPRASASRETYDQVILKELKKHSVELVILAGYMRIVTPVLIQAYRNKIMNIHPSLLPAFPGLHAQRQALAYGVKVSGCTVHFVDEQVDHGPIISQMAVPVLENDTEETLETRILAEEHKLYVQAIQLFAAGRLEFQDRKVFIKGPR
ncbi:MAG TPA: phosphoribosylglycinamide formyltransferase [Nitrospiria bacterium]|jgi:phosphoribosylglycinamide formyltransferase-1|nr:phosphoribosylglycinamide formyltransferase [Nitrospiria bacterium]